MSNPQEVSPEVKDRIFDAVLAELVASGIDSFRVEAVARRAGVETAVISARWHDSRVLLMDAILTRAAKLSPTPDTGSLTGDLAALTTSMSEFSASDLGRQWIHRLLPNGRDADLSEVGTDFWAARFSSFEPILQRAFKNDELRVGVDPREAIRMFASALNYDVIFTDAPVRPGYAAQALETFLYGILRGETHDAELRRDFEARERARTLLRATTDAMLDPQALLEAVRDDDGHVTDFTFGEVNPAACKYFDQRREDLLGASLSTILPRVEGSGLLSRLAHCVNTGEPLVIEDFTYFSDGLQQVQEYDLRAARASYDWLSVTWRNVTETSQANRRVWESEERYRLLAENAWDVIWTMGLDGTITYISPSVERVRGITAEEAMKQSPDEINPPESAARVSGYFADLFSAIANGTEPPVFRDELEYYRKDGSIMTGELEVIPRVDADGKVAEIMGVTRDVGDRKRFEASEARYRDLIENSIVATSVSTSDGRLVMVNKAMCDWLGYDAETLLSKTWQDVIVVADPENPQAPDSAGRSVNEAARDATAAPVPEEFNRVAERVVGRVQTYQGKWQFIHADGHPVWGYTSVFGLSDSDGMPQYLVGQTVEITDQADTSRRRE